MRRPFDVWVLAALAVALPVAMAPGVSFAFDAMPKAFLAWAGTALLLFRWALQTAYPAAARSAQTGRLWLAAFLLGIVSLAVSLLLAQDFWLSLYGSSWRRMGALTQASGWLVAVAVSIAVFRHRDSARFLGGALLLGASVASLYAIAQYFGFDPFLDPAWYRAPWGPVDVVRPPSALGHALYFSNFAAAIAVAAAGLFANSGRSPLYALACLSCSAAALLSGSRSAWLALGAGLALVTLRSEFRLRLRTAAVTAGLALSLAASLWFSPAGAPLRARGGQWISDWKGGARLLVWRDCLPMIAAFPLAGTGPDSFVLAFPRYASADLMRRFPDHYHEAPHNAFFDLACDNGLPSLAAVILVLYLSGRAWLRRQGAVWPAPALAALAVGQLFASWTIASWFAFAFLAGLQHGSLSAEEDQPAHNHRSAPLFSLAAAALGSFFLLSAGQLLLNDVIEARVLRELDSGRLSQALALHARLPAAGMRGPDHQALLARLFAGATGQPGAWNAAVRSARRASETAEDRFAARAFLGMLQMAAGDVSGAALSFESSASLFPNWYLPHLLLSRAYAAQLRPADAQREESLARSLNPQLHP